MNKAEAIQAMILGKKVTHKYFSREEWMTMEKTVVEGWMIILEDGVKCKPEVFWSDRTQPFWNDGYSLYI